MGGTLVAPNFASLCRPPATGFYFPGNRQNPPLCEFVSVLCQQIADLDVLADLGRRKNSKLHGINGRRGTDSVPGHHLFHQITKLSFGIFIPFHSKTMARDDSPRRECWRVPQVDLNPHQIEAALFASRSPLRPGIRLTAGCCGECSNARLTQRREGLSSVIARS